MPGLRSEAETVAALKADLVDVGHEIVSNRAALEGLQARAGLPSAPEPAFDDFAAAAAEFRASTQLQAAAAGGGAGGGSGGGSGDAFKLSGASLNALLASSSTQ